ncbi:DUF6702 family protein [Deminuibacter soli]|uniref:Peptidase E n=1 Tax=Deminuibacter soli TaxID=2291815 RepID=A0A3E1NME4_9BACT|nr:DUF6702 family protein [Deminuibacter soli]RFM29099.1 hypothetical protein DXN05_10110 [Deminuibacter soli]
MATVLLHSFLSIFLGLMHPFYVSMTDIQHNTTNKSLEISVRIFTDDFEGALRKNYPGKIDLIHPPDKNAINHDVADYINKHLQLQVNGKPAPYTFVGFEQQEESTWCYFEVSNVATLQQLQITNTLLHDYNTNQINMMHIKTGSKEKSDKLDYPDAVAKFVF